MISSEDKGNFKSPLEYSSIVNNVFNKYIPQKQEDARKNLLNNSQFKSLMEIFPGMVWVMDIASQSYPFVSDNVKSILGYSPEDFYNEGFNLAAKVFYEPHNDIILHEILPKKFHFFVEYVSKGGDLKNLRVTFNYWVYRKDRSIGSMHHHLTVLNTDEYNKAHLTLILLTDISDIKKDNSIVFTISEKKENDIFYPVYSKTYLSPSENKALPILSNRETEILNLISQGKSSNEISKMLFISENTVYKHRKNMLKKMESKSSAELLSKAIALGII
jgi:DNA-binding CsgD family transcriptional regulator